MRAGNGGGKDDSVAAGEFLAGGRGSGGGGADRISLPRTRTLAAGFGCASTEGAVVPRHGGKRFRTLLARMAPICRCPRGHSPTARIRLPCAAQLARLRLGPAVVARDSATSRKLNRLGSTATPLFRPGYSRPVRRRRFDCCARAQLARPRLDAAAAVGGCGRAGRAGLLRASPPGSAAHRGGCCAPAGVLRRRGLGCCGRVRLARPRIEAVAALPWVWSGGRCGRAQLARPHLDPTGTRTA